MNNHTANVAYGLQLKGLWLGFFILISISYFQVTRTSVSYQYRNNGLRGSNRRGKITEILMIYSHCKGPVPGAVQFLLSKLTAA